MYSHQQLKNTSTYDLPIPYANSVAPNKLHCTDLEGHEVSQHHGVTDVNAHAMALHGVDDLVHDGFTCCFNAQCLEHLNNAVGGRFAPLNTCTEIIRRIKCTVN